MDEEIDACHVTARPIEAGNQAELDRIVPDPDKIVRLVYLDEAGTSNPKEEPFLVVAGVAVNADRQFKEVEACLDSVLRKHVSEPDGIVFHTMELWHGTKQFHRDHFPLEKH